MIRKAAFPMDDIPPRSYGPLIEMTVRIITWNVWGLYGPWQEREAVIAATLRDARPDIVVLPNRGPRAATASAAAWPSRSAWRTTPSAASRPRKTRRLCLA